MKKSTIWSKEEKIRALEHLAKNFFQIFFSIFLKKSSIFSSTKNHSFGATNEIRMSVLKAIRSHLVHLWTLAYCQIDSPGTNAFGKGQKRSQRLKNRLANFH